MADPPPLLPANRGPERGARVEHDAAAEAASRVRSRLEREADERDRAHRRRVLVGGAVTVVVALVVGMAIALTMVDSEPRAAAPGVSRPFDALGPAGVGITGASDAAFSPDGTKLLVKRGGGALGIAEGGRFRPIVPAETNVVAHAWYGTSRVLVQEGPVSTGRLAVIDVDGTDRGGLALAPDVAPGNGVAVSADGSMAVLVSYGSVDFPGQPTPVDLWVAELPSGAARRLTSTPSAVESDPHFVDRERAAVTVRDAGNTSVVTLDLRSGSTTRVASAGADARVLGVIRQGTDRAEVVWSDGSTIYAAPADGDGERRRLGSAPSGTQPLDIDPAAQRLVVRETSDDGADSQLRVVSL
ncbi:MAG TPA: hypothetical protein VF230_01975 [Acidimicrobiales bacterium]